MEMVLKPLYMKPRDLSPIAKPEPASKQKKKLRSFLVCGCFDTTIRGLDHMTVPEMTCVFSRVSG